MNLSLWLWLAVKGRFVLDGFDGPVNWPDRFVGNRKPRSGPNGWNGLKPLDQSDEAASAQGVGVMSVAGDGAFVVDPVFPGVYQFNYSLVEPHSQVAEEVMPNLPIGPPNGLGRRQSRSSSLVAFHMRQRFLIENRTESLRWAFLDVFPVANLSQRVVISEPEPELDSKAPGTLDIGEFRMEFSGRPGLRQMAPLFKARQTDGSLFDLSAHRGRWVMLMFSHSQPYEAQSQLDELLEHAETLQNDNRMTLAIVSLEEGPLAITRRENRPPLSIPWPIIAGGAWEESEIAKQYGVIAVPETFLIDPEGRVVGLHLQGQKLLDVLDGIKPVRAAESANLSK